MELVTKKCPNCGASIDFDCDLETAQCCYCNSMVFVKQTPKDSDTFSPCTNNIPQKKQGMSCLLKTVLTIFAIIGLLILVFIVFVIYEVINEEANSSGGGSVYVQTTRAPDADETYEYAPGESFRFQGFEITIKDTITWLNNPQFDEDDVTSWEFIAKLPITLTNLSDETRRFSWSALTIYGTAGISIRSGFSFDNKDDVQHYLRDMRGGATSSDMYIYVPYDGDGYYYISFDTYDEATREIKIHISR